MSARNGFNYSRKAHRDLATVDKVQIVFRTDEDVEVHLSVYGCSRTFDGTSKSQLHKNQYNRDPNSGHGDKGPSEAATDVGESEIGSHCVDLETAIWWRCLDSGAIETAISAVHEKLVDLYFYGDLQI